MRCAPLVGLLIAAAGSIALASAIGLRFLCAEGHPLCSWPQEIIKDGLP